MYWRLISRVRRQVGRKQTPKEIRELIFQMVADNPFWGAPRIHGKLRMLGFDLSEGTISRWMKRAPRDPDQAKRWLALLRNHREAIAAMDFFTVPTIRLCALHAHSGSCPPGSSCCIEAIIAFRPGLLYQEPPRLGSWLEFWRTTRG